MTLYAVLSDIHANFHALQATEKDAKRAAKDLGEDLKYICLGDVVDYGPHPNECAKWVLKRQAAGVLEIVCGNHDESAMVENDCFEHKNGVHVYAPSSWHISSTYWPISFWTRQNLMEALKTDICKWPKTSQSRDLMDVCLFHDSLANGHGRIDSLYSAKANFEQFKNQHGFFGHTHYQGYYSKDEFEDTVREFYAVPVAVAKDMEEREKDEFARKKSWRPISVVEKERLAKDDFQAWGAAGVRLLINPGSVGQPRHPDDLDHDAKAAYLLVLANGSSDLRFAFRRAAYDIKAMRKDLCAMRWTSSKAEAYRDFLLRNYEEKASHETDHNKEYYQTLVSFLNAETKKYYPKSKRGGQAVTGLNEVLRHLVEEHLVKNFREP